MGNNWLLRLAQAIVVLAGVTLTTLAKAEIVEAMDGMWRGIVTDAGTYKSAYGTTASGGEIKLRSPNRAFNIVSFKSPYIRAGCSGVDMYGGSFSFINGEQFRMLLRQIGANAAGYAFQLALKAMCESCENLLSELQAKLQRLNEMFKNSCQLAKGMMNAVDGYFDHPRTEIIDNAVKTAAGQAGDYMDELLKYFEDENEIYGNGPCDKRNPMQCNSVAQTFEKNALDDLVDMLGLNLSSKGRRELMMNFFGAELNVKDESGTGGKGKTIRGDLTFHDLMTGSKADNQKKYYFCDNNDCLNVTLGTWAFEGVAKYVETLLKGTITTASGKKQYDPNSTLGRLSTGAMTADDLSLLVSAGDNYLRYAVYLQGCSEHAENLIDAMAPRIKNAMHLQLGRYLFEIGTKMYQQGGEAVPAFHNEKLSSLRNELEIAETAFRSSRVADNHAIQQSAQNSVNECMASKPQTSSK